MFKCPLDVRFTSTTAATSASATFSPGTSYEWNPYFNGKKLGKTTSRMFIVSQVPLMYDFSNWHSAARVTAASTNDSRPPGQGLRHQNAVYNDGHVGALK